MKPIAKRNLGRPLAGKRIATEKITQKREDQMDTQYAYRIETKKVMEEDFPYGNSPISGSQKLFEFAKSLQDLDYEKFLVLHLDSSLKISCIQYFTGTINEAAIYPREVLKHSILSGATGIIIVHNHPSGAFKFSEEDKQITHKLSKCYEMMDMKVYDHVLIYGKDKYKSMKEEGEI